MSCEVTAGLDRHAVYSLALMLLPEIRDRAAISGGPIDLIAVSPSLEPLRARAAAESPFVTINRTGSDSTIALIDIRPGAAGATPSAIGTVVGVGTDRGVASAQLEAAGFAPRRRLQPPADAERALVSGELFAVVAERGQDE